MSRGRQLALHDNQSLLGTHVTILATILRIDILRSYSMTANQAKQLLRGGIDCIELVSSTEYGLGHEEGVLDPDNHVRPRLR